MPNYVKPADILEASVTAGAAKANLPLLDMIVRGLYSGFMLGVSTTLAAMGTTQTGLPMVGALLFPCGFMMIVYYGFELVTGNMLLIPIAFMARRATFLGMMKNLSVVWICNLLGCSLYLAFFYGQVTQFGAIPGGGAIGKTIVATGLSKTVKYVEHGGLGWAACLVKAILCNFLVSFAALGSLSSTGTVGKLVACWIPVIMFAVLGYEHVVVNMFVIPCSMALGSGVTWGEWWGWNLVPATLGNMIGAMIMVSVPMWVTWGHEYRKKQKLEAKLEATDLLTAPETPYIGYGDSIMEVEPEEPLFVANLAQNTPDHARSPAAPAFY